MNVVWTDPALDDLEGIRDYIRQHNPQAALRIYRALIWAAEGLAVFPKKGRHGDLPGTREWSIVRPYVLLTQQIIAD